jgi:hypothetical protein
MGERSAYRFLVGKPKRKGNLEDPGVEGKITFKWIFVKSAGGYVLV